MLPNKRESRNRDKARTDLLAKHGRMEPVPNALDWPGNPEPAAVAQGRAPSAAATQVDIGSDRVIAFFDRFDNRCGRMEGMPRLSEVGSAAVELSRIVSAQDLRAVLERILASRHFSSAGRRKKFLTVVIDYYVTGRADQLNEFCLGVEVFGFDQHYDPAANASVRVCAHDVRKRLKEYFEQEGASERLLIQIPPGAYKPVFLERARDLPPVALPPPEATPSSHAVGWSCLWLSRQPRCL